jgi:addiction module HigA family antidote
MALMHDPPHPGEVLRELYLEPLGLSVTAAAAALGVTRKTLSALVNGHQGISAEMAYRLARAFDTTPDLWMNLQKQADLWAARGTNVSRVRRLAQASA